MDVHVKTMTKEFSSLEDATKWVKDQFGVDVPKTQPLQRSFQEYWNSLPKYGEEPNIDEYLGQGLLGSEDAQAQQKTDPKPMFKPGTVMTDIGIYVDENGTLWHVDPVDGDVSLLIPDDDV